MHTRMRVHARVLHRRRGIKKREGYRDTTTREEEEEEEEVKRREKKRGGERDEGCVTRGCSCNATRLHSVAHRTILFDGAPV